MPRSRIFAGLRTAQLPFVGLVLAIFARTFLIQGLVVSSISMEPTLVPGDHVIVDRLSAKLPRRRLLPTRPLRRGDVIVLRSPADSRTLLLKRCAAVPGEVVETNAGETLTLPAGQYWVLGDNLDQSFDSRAFGPVEEDSILGRAMLIYWSKVPGTRAKTRWERTMSYIE